MTKIIWMSDPHYQSRGTFNGVNSRARLSAALDHANTHHPDAAFIVISGDMTGDETEDDYRDLAEIFSRSNLPVHPMPGNHDDRALFLRLLSLPETAMPDFAQYSLSVPEGVVLCLDTHKPSSSAGELCAARRDWVSAQLEAAGDRPVFVFMHHPPLALGLPMQDTIMLQEADTTLDLLSGKGNVRYMFMGHVHRPTSGSIRGIPFSTLGSITFQAPAPRPEWDWDSFVPPAEPPQYGVVLLSGGDVTVQFTQFCDHSFGMDPA